MKRLDKKSMPIILFVLFLFIMSFFWRRDKNAKIDAYSKYAIATITKKVGSLKNGNEWYYEFVYKDKVYVGSRPTHVGYNVNVGDFYLVQFSFKNPQLSRIFYEYQLSTERFEYRNGIWDTIPTTILQYRKKKDKFW